MQAEEQVFSNHMDLQFEWLSAEGVPFLFLQHEIEEN